MSVVAIDELRAQEAIVERNVKAFMEVGTALMRIRDERLYEADGFDGFVEYLESKPWGISSNWAYKQIDAARVFTMVQTPINERQARELAPLLKKSTAAVVRQVYHEAQTQAAAEGKPVTAAILKEKVQEVLPPKNGGHTPTRRNKSDDLIVQHLSEIKALIPRWEPSAMDAKSAAECRRRARLAEHIAQWLENEFLAAHQPRIDKFIDAPT